MASARPPAKPVPEARWIYRPSVDLIVGCGAWSVPLLVLATRAGGWTRTGAVAFYVLSLAFNYPHYMATVYRAYRTRTDFARYRLFTFHITLALAIVAAASHVWSALVPLIFTVYITWSPWHYTGQNFGLAMMFVRRNGVAPTNAERRMLWLAFLASYALLFLSFHTGPSNDPLVRSLGIPDAVASPARTIFLLVVLVCGALPIARWFLRAGAKAMLAPFVLVATQATWFVVPAIAEWAGGTAAPQTRYSNGVLALMHSAQYLWITSYYAKREAATTQSVWRPWAYATTLVVGGVALFVPGPWLTSYLFHIDFSQSVLIFTAIVNIHHFVLDGAIWKLRDARIASLLVDSRDRAVAAAGDAAAAVQRATWSLAANTPRARAIRITAVVLLVTWAALDQTRFVLGTDDRSLPALTWAARLNPYDSVVRQRAARTLIQQGRDAEAEDAYQRVLAAHPDDGEALFTLGVLAMRHQRPDEALARLESIPEGHPARIAARPFLAQLWATRADALAQAGRAADAAHAFQRALTFDDQDGNATASATDWFNYGQFLKSQHADSVLVLACLIHAEQLFGDRSAPREAVAGVRRAVERDQPGAAARARQTLDASLAAAHTLY